MVSSVRAVHSSPTHDFSKDPMPSITLLEGIGVSGDAHAGTTVQHRSRVARDPSTPNLRQVHLIHGELFDHLRDEGFTVEPGSLGENITTRGVDLLELPVGTRLSFGEATVVVTGLRNPCRQIDDLQPGLMKHIGQFVLAGVEDAESGEVVGLETIGEGDAGGGQHLV